MTYLTRESLLKHFRVLRHLPGTGYHRAVREKARIRTGTRILLYHRVSPQADDDLLQMQVSCRHFEAHLAWLSAHYSVISLNTLARQLSAGRVPDRQVVITFDDGYRDNRHYAAELLRHYRLPATFFLTAGVIGGSRRFWWDEVAARLRAAAVRDPAVLAQRVWTACSELRPLPGAQRDTLITGIGDAPPPPHPDELPMTWEEAGEIARMGLTVGAHTLTHPALSDLHAEEARQEIAGSRRVLEERLGSPIRHFCYPYDERIRWGRSVPPSLLRLVREAGYETASTVISGGLHRSVDPLALPRLAVQNWSLDRFIEEIG